MGSTVFANMMGISHKKSGGKSPVFPDVCKTPTPGGPVPIPYPNLAESSNLAKGSKTVEIEGQMAAIKGCKQAQVMRPDQSEVWHQARQKGKRNLSFIPLM